MLIPAENRASNILQATPALLAIPAPTIDTLATSVLTSMALQPMTSLFSSISSRADWASPSATVKLISLLPSRPMD